MTRPLQPWGNVYSVPIVCNSEPVCSRFRKEKFFLQKLYKKFITFAKTKDFPHSFKTENFLSSKAAFSFSRRTYVFVVKFIKYFTISLFMM